MILTIVAERPDSPEVIRLLAELDEYQTALYPPESNHLLSIEELLAPNVVFLVARQNGEAVGCGAVRFEAEYGEIKRMYVRPEQRGNGVARQLLQVLCDAVQSHGLALARLETGISQPEALRLYERAGFYRIGPFGDYPDDPVSLFYERRLP